MHRTVVGWIASLLVVSALAAGCSFRFGYDGTAYACGDGGSCPDGFHCVASFCQPDDTVVPDAGSDGGAVAACGALSLLHDDFDDGVVAPGWFAWNEPGTSVSEAGGQMTIHVDASTGSYAGSVSRRAFDLAGSSMAVTVVQAGGEHTILEVRGPAEADPRAQIVAAASGMLEAVVLNTPAQLRTQIPYDPIAQRHWRLREDAGTLYWETSPDGTAWTSFHDEPVPFATEHVLGSLAAGGNLPTAGDAIFDDVNLPAAAGAYCSTSRLVDAFGDAAIGPVWEPFADPQCQILETGGVLELQYPAAGGSAYCRLDSRHLYDLRGSSIAIEAVSMPSATDFESFFQVLSEDGRDQVFMSISLDVLYMTVKRNGATVAETSTVFDPVAHRFWRIREASGTLHWETAPDGATWTERASTATVIDVSAMIVQIAAGHWSATSAAQTVRFDRFN